MSLEFMEDMDIIPLDDIDIEYSRASDMVKKIVTSFLRDQNVLYLVSLLHPKEIEESYNIPDSMKKHLNLGYSLYRSPPQFLPNVILTAFSSFTDPDIIDSCGFAVSVWLAQQGPDMLETVTRRAKELLSGK